MEILSPTHGNIDDDKFHSDKRLERDNKFNKIK